MGPSSRGEVQKISMNSCSACEEDGSVVTWEGSEVSDGFSIFRCSEGTAPSSRGLVQKFLMDSLLCCSEVTAPSSRGLVQKFLMVSLFCCSEGTAPSSRGKVQVQNILMRSCCRREGNGSVVTCNGSEDPDGFFCRNVVWCSRVCLISTRSWFCQVQAASS